MSDHLLRASCFIAPRVFGAHIRILTTPGTANPFQVRKGAPERFRDPPKVTQPALGRAGIGIQLPPAPNEAKGLVT